jgi:uncharacterized surface protein with fasciclin (FAS1) repeats
MKATLTRPGLKRAALVIALGLGAIVGASAKQKQPRAPKGHDITDTIYANPILTGFAKMLQASPDVYTFLSSRGPFTVFVPTDSAFAKLKPGELAALLRPENTERRNDILLFHVINGKRLMMKDLISLRATFSCQGNPLSFRLSHSGVFLVQKSKITHADIHCANGNINETDTVLMPPELALPSLKFAPDAGPTAQDPPPPPPVTRVPIIGDTNAAPVSVKAVTIPIAPPSK